MCSNMLLFTLSVGFFLGVLSIILLEFLGFLFLIKRLNRKKVKDQDFEHQFQQVDGDHLDLSFPNKQGPVWVLDLEKVPKHWMNDKGSREQKRKIEVLEVNPVHKYAKLKDQLLLITDSNGSSTEIRLKGCTIAAVSATNLPSRKWAKKYPIKVESETSAIYHGDKRLYIYFETSVEKESWSKALRIASCTNDEKLMAFAKLRVEFQNYLTALNTEYPSLMKPIMGFSAESIDKSIKIDGSSSKVRHFLKRLTKKTSKSGIDFKADWSSTGGREGKSVNEKFRLPQESVAATCFPKPPLVGKVPNSIDENTESATISRSGSRNSFSAGSEAEIDDKHISDEGTLCWNILLSRLFFDVKSNSMIKSIAQARIQRSLSNVRTPSYIESMTSNSETTSVDEVASDLLEGIEHYRNQLKLSEETAEKMEAKTEGNPKIGKIKSFKSSLQGSTCASKWKSIINTVAKQVSQVPLSLGMRVASLRGILRLEIRGPPSDQIWLAFTSMPDIDLNLESSVGEHKITSAHIALFLINRFKAAIRETMVLPNFENINISFMTAEKDDWIPRQAAPFVWINQESSSDSTTLHEPPSSQQNEAAQLSGSRREPHSKLGYNENKVDELEGLQLQTKKSLSTSSNSINQSSLNENPLQELKIPLLGDGEAEPTPWLIKEEHVERQEPKQKIQSPSRSASLSELSSRSVSISDEEAHSMLGDDARPKRIGSTRAKMLGLGKKMGDKFEERRRHIEEKGRNIVQRMRGPDKGVSQ
ncbi:putative integral membrane protein conserved region (DUF2404) [Heracleum sosnowskyi]|uniref:Integral membrane protein conserved region (DUF2404) n=1 Tax=Heracleum sosnowskyi TaxID=360622 RepID=A0AAD8JI89_9APIA|nr:putative integral membrane protein conserved region (DUF2404) [Heracleum sosnowskyi]